MECSIGLCLKRKCAAGKQYRSSHQFSSREWNLFKLRSGVHCLKTVCESHACQFGRYYSAKQKQCCNPLNVHAKNRSKGLTTISAQYHDQFHKHVEHVIEGRKICLQCDKAVRATANTALPDELVNNTIHAENGKIEKSYEITCLLYIQQNRQNLKKKPFSQ